MPESSKVYHTIPPELKKELSHNCEEKVPKKLMSIAL